MIRKEEVLAIARLNGIEPRFAELDYIQDVALINISKEFGNRLVFKGGTCLYKVYRLDRFSEDLDFTAQKGFKQRDFFQRLPYFFSLLNLKARVNIEQFQSNVNVYLEVIGPLYDGKKQTMTTLIFNISQRERVLLPIQRFRYTSIHRELKPFDIFAMDEKEILAEKVRAIYGRNKARDVYDLWYLLIRNGLSFDLAFVNKKLSYDKVRFEKGAFLAKVDEKRMSWERDLMGLVSGQLPPFAQVKKEIMSQIDNPAQAIQNRKD